MVTDSVWARHELCWDLRWVEQNKPGKTTAFQTRGEGKSLAMFRSLALLSLCPAVSIASPHQEPSPKNPVILTNPRAGCPTRGSYLSKCYQLGVLEPAASLTSAGVAGAEPWEGQTYWGGEGERGAAGRAGSCAGGCGWPGTAGTATPTGGARCAGEAPESWQECCSCCCCERQERPSGLMWREKRPSTHTNIASAAPRIKHSMGGTRVTNPSYHFQSYPWDTPFFSTCCTCSVIFHFSWSLHT